MGNSGEPLICDFGISRILSHSLSNGGTSSANLKGSARWMAPELFNLEIDTHHTKETDMWAFGMTVYVRTSRISFRRSHDPSPGNTHTSSAILYHPQRRTSNIRHYGGQATVASAMERMLIIFRICVEYLRSVLDFTSGEADYYKGGGLLSSIQRASTRPRLCRR